MKRTLGRIGLRHGTDKAGQLHDFTRFYPSYMEVYREKPLSFLEIGVFRGASLRMWDEYFTHPDARLSCVDNKLKHLRNVPSPSRWTSFLGNQADRKFLENVGNQMGPFDVVVEDGQHVPSYQIASFKAIWPYVKPGGFYVIEDIHTSFQEGFIERHAPEDGGPRSIMPFLLEMLERMVSAAAPGDTEFEFIHFYTHAVILARR